MIQITPASTALFASRTLPQPSFTREYPFQSTSLQAVSVLPTPLNALKARVRFAADPAKPAGRDPASLVAQFEGLMQARLREKAPDFKLDEFQKKAMQHLAQGDSVMVSAPTSSGKTLVGNFAIEAAINPTFWADPQQPPERSRLFYTTPRKAISNEKFRDFVQEYGAQNVGLMTGDVTLNPEAPVILMTTEVLRNMLYEEPEKLGKVAKVVFDECHFVNDSDRGPVWEECMIHMPPQVQQIHLSATVGNAKQYTDWMNKIATQKAASLPEGQKTPVTQLVSVNSDDRPVSLEYLFYNPRVRQLERVFSKDTGLPVENFFEAMGERRNIGKNRQNKKHGQHRHDSAKPSKPFKFGDLVEAMNAFKAKTGVDLRPSVLTMFSKRGCDQYFAEAVRRNKPLLSPPERSALDQLIEAHKQIDPDIETLNPAFINGLRQGYGVHHAGMTYAERSLVEQALKKGLLKFVFATDTLGAGINVPERTATFTQYDKFNGDAFEGITPSDFHQIAGRAGRRGIYEPGFVVLTPPKQPKEDGATSILDLIESPPDKLMSKFVPTPTMVLNLLKTHTLEEARDVMGKSFAAYQADESQNLQGDFDRITKFLVVNKLLALKADPKTQKPTLELTPLGRDMSVVPNTAFVAVLSLLKGASKWNQLCGEEEKKALSKFTFGSPINPEELAQERRQAKARAFERLTPEEKALTGITQLTRPELAALVSATLSDEKDNIPQASNPSPEFNRLMKAFLKADDSATQSALSAGIQDQTEVDFSFASFIRKWMESEGDWKAVRRATESSRIRIGDFMNNVRRTANLLEKLSQLQTLPSDLKASFQKTREELLKPPIAESFYRLSN